MRSLLSAVSSFVLLLVLLIFGPGYLRLLREPSSGRRRCRYGCVWTVETGALLIRSCELHGDPAYERLLEATGSATEQLLTLIPIMYRVGLAGLEGIAVLVPEKDDLRSKVK